MPSSTRALSTEATGPSALLVIGAALAALSLFLAMFGPTLAPYDPLETTGRFSVPPPPLLDWPSLLWQTMASDLPQAPHWFGTDQSGLDVFSRVIAAPRTDMTIALTGALFSLALGSLLGLVAGFWRNAATELLMRVSDVLQSFPVFITAMVLVALAGRNTANIVLALTLVYTPIFIRLTRAEVMTQTARGYTEAARALGNPPWRVALVHVLPNSLVPALVQTSVTIGFAIILTAGLSFVGAGVRPPTPEWGLMISQGAPQMILGEWWPSLFPGLAITFSVFGFAVLGHALEERFK
jgi:peptide/nickel transport system permease protein